MWHRYCFSLNESFYYLFIFPFTIIIVFVKACFAWVYYLCIFNRDISYKHQMLRYLNMSSSSQKIVRRVGHPSKHERKYEREIIKARLDVQLVYQRVREFEPRECDEEANNMQIIRKHQQTVQSERAPFGGDHRERACGGPSAWSGGAIPRSTAQPSAWSGGAIPRSTAQPSW